MASQLTLTLGVAALLGATASGCESTVPLGAECLPFGGVCSDRDGRDGDDAPADGDSDGDGMDDGGDGSGGGFDSGAGELDAAGIDGSPDTGAADGGTADANTPGDAGDPVDPSDGGLALFPLIGNPSFDLQNGSPAGEYGTIGSADISPWYHCQTPTPGFYRVEESTSELVATEGDTYFSFGFPVVYDLPLPVYQELAEPLRAGQRYAFMVDVRSEAGLEEMIALSVRGGNTTCESLTTLGGTEYLADGQWVERCITFTPPTDLTQLALVPVVRGVIAVTFKLLVDNIRPDPRCQ